MTDLISRMGLLEDLSASCYDLDALTGITGDERKLKDAILQFPTVDAVPVVHKKDIRSSVITVKDSDEWQDRIILAEESTQICAVYYADDSERVPVVHARWIGFPNGIVWDLKCDACHRIIPMGQTPETMHYCPQCGARMDGEENVVD